MRCSPSAGQGDREVSPDASREERRFRHVVLRNWRNFRRVNVDLSGRVFLVGPNASGKSNFLDAFRFLHDVVSIGGGLQEAVRRRGGVKSIRNLAARQDRMVSIGVQVTSKADSGWWEYEVAFAQDKARRTLVEHEIVSRDGKPVLSRPTPDDEADPQRLTQTFLEQVNVNREFRELFEFFSSVQYLHIVPQLVREPDRSVGRTNDPYGGDFLEQVAGVTAKTRNAWLRRIRDALRVAVPQLQELELWRDLKGTAHIRGKYEHWRPQGAWQTEESFSDGTLRLMGLLWAALQGTGPLLLEEPELSLHPEVVRHIPQMLARMERRSGRQVFISTHSSDLLRDEGIGLNEVLLLSPEHEGTSVRVAADLEQVRALLEGGLTVADAVIPMTQPREAAQLALFIE
jgi:predicted ATPase